MDAKAAGKLMQAHRKRKGLTQDQVVERSTVPTPQYLSALENGRYDVRNSEHFKSLIALYGLTADQVSEVSPDAVITVNVASVETQRPRSRALPHGLQEAVELYGKRYSDLQDTTWQNYLAGFRWREGEPEEPEAWLDLYRDLIRAGVVPGSN